MNQGPPPRKQKVQVPPRPEPVPEKVHIIWQGDQVVAHVWLDEKGLHTRRPDHAIVSISIQEALDAVEGQGLLWKA